LPLTAASVTSISAPAQAHQQDHSSSLNEPIRGTPTDRRRDEEMSSAPTDQREMPDELSPRRIRRRLVQFAAVGVLIGILVLVGPGLGGVRSHLRHASAGWLAAAVALGSFQL
jgi:hypothetical protein